MARARNIKPGFFRNADLVELPIEARLLFIGLWTIADRAGRLEDRPKQIKMELFPADNMDCDALLNDLSSIGMVERYEVDGKRYLQVINFSKHQNPHKEEKASTIPDANGNVATTEKAPCKHRASTVQSVCKDGSNRADSLIPDSLNLIPDSLQEQVVDSQPETKKPTATATRLPADWMPSSDDIDFCAKERSDLAPLYVADRFRDYWIAQPGAKGKKLDWQATWRNWVRNEKRQTLPSGLGKSQRDIERDEVSDVLCGRKRPALTERVITGEVINAS
jgi:hypothetical protein